jgi:hypothetical protein
LRHHRNEHLLILAFAVVALVGSFYLRPLPNGRLGFPIPLTTVTATLPETCMSRTIFGVSCPGCGLTRSFTACAHGEWSTAFALNALGPILFVLVALQIPYRLAVLLRIGEGGVARNLIDRAAVPIAWLIIVGLVAGWLWRLLP